MNSALEVRNFLNRSRAKKNSPLQTETGVLRRRFCFTYNAWSHIFLETSPAQLCSEFPSASHGFLRFAVAYKFVILWPKTGGILSRKILKFQSEDGKRRLLSAAVKVI